MIVGKHQYRSLKGFVLRGDCDGLGNCIWKAAMGSTHSLACESRQKNDVGDSAATVGVYPRGVGASLPSSAKRA